MLVTWPRVARLRNSAPAGEGVFTKGATASPVLPPTANVRDRETQLSLGTR